MTSRSDEVKQRMHAVVPETRVTLDARFFGEKVVVLAFEEADDFLEAVDRANRSAFMSLQKSERVDDYSRILIVNVLAESRGINDSQANTHPILLKLDVNRLDTDPLLEMRRLGVVADLVPNHFCFA